jgi:IMP dehydrogenase
MTEVAIRPSTASSIDAEFYKPAASFFRSNLPVALTFDDVSLATLYSDVLPRETDAGTSLSDTLRLSIPIISSDMDTVTEARMAIAMALNGGLGIIHYNMAARDQVKEVARVKRHIHGLIQDPITVTPDQHLGDVLAMIDQRRFEFRTFPVVDSLGQARWDCCPAATVRDRYRAKEAWPMRWYRESDILTVHERTLQPDPIAAADSVSSRKTCRHPQDAGRGRWRPAPRPGDVFRRGADHGGGQVAPQAGAGLRIPVGGGGGDCPRAQIQTARSIGTA